MDSQSLEILESYISKYSKRKTVRNLPDRYDRYVQGEEHA
jgi:hypothetical protein